MEIICHPYIHTDTHECVVCRVKDLYSSPPPLLLPELRNPPDDSQTPWHIQNFKVYARAPGLMSLTFVLEMIIEIELKFSNILLF